MSAALPNALRARFQAYIEDGLSGRAAAARLRLSAATGVRWHDSLIAPWVIKGAMDAEAFAAYIREVLAPNLQPGRVVICDTLATHRNKDAARALRDVGCWFLYLPPYSPDLNLIEMAFSKLKAHLRRVGARTFDQMFDARAKVFDLYTPQKCWNHFCEAGYGSS